MAIETRVSKDVVAGVTEDQYLYALSQYAAADARACRLIALMETELAAVRDRYDGRHATLQANMGRHYEVVEAYAKEHKHTLFAQRRSTGTIYGTIGFRLGTPRLKLMPGATWDAVLSNLRSLLPQYVRTTEEPAKDRLISDRAREEVAAVLPQLGVQVVQDEKFFIEVKKETAGV